MGDGGGARVGVEFGICGLNCLCMKERFTESEGNKRECEGT